jgi:hypothetical protein
MEESKGQVMVETGRNAVGIQCGEEAGCGLYKLVYLCDLPWRR